MCAFYVLIVLDHYFPFSQNELQLNHQRRVSVPSRSLASTARSRMQELDQIAADAEEDMFVAFWVKMANIAMLSF